MGRAAENGQVEVLERLHAAGGDINFTDSVSVFNIDIAAVFSQIVCREWGCIGLWSPHTAGGGLGEAKIFFKNLLEVS